MARILVGTSGWSLGLATMLGDGRPEDHAEAAKWWRKAEEQGNASAQINLGIVYEQGDGVQKDFDKGSPLV